MTESIPTTPSAEYWIEYLGLHAHPEGGFYREVYRATDRIAGEALPARYEKRPHAAATSIYFLLDAPHVSRFHRLASDEIWYFHAGEAIAIHLLHADGSHQVLRIGPNPASGDSFQSVVVQPIEPALIRMHPFDVVSATATASAFTAYHCINFFEACSSG